METFGQPMWIGSYRLTSRIATGGMAEIYVGRHITPEGTFGPMVAVKKLLPHLVKDAAIVRMFLNEARITSQIHHPNVVRIFELGQVDGEPFIAMELLEGRTWAELRQRAAEDARRMPSPVALRILADACRGLDAAHHAVGEDGQPLSLVHRDFTPDNIHVGVKGDVKVIDFGIARTNAWGSGTEPGTLKGKFFYMSPEMISSKPVDHRADIFAAGVMLYEQLCGRRPFTGTSIDEVVIRIAREDVAPPSSWDPSVPKPLEQICLRALEKDPNRRFQTLAELVTAMEQAQNGSFLASSDEVAGYVSALFPEKTDERRSTIRRAREADPSIPALTPVKGEPIAAPLAAPSAGAPDPTPTGSDPTRSDPTRSDPARFKTKVAVIAGAVLLLGVATAAIIALSSPARSVHEQLALARSQQGTARAKALLKVGALLDASAVELNEAATLLEADAQWDTLLELTELWSKRDPQSVDARLFEAKAATAKRFSKRAEAALDLAQKLAPTDGRPWLVRARLRELQGEPTATAEAWALAAERNPDDGYAVARAGYWLSQQGKLDEAEKLLRQATRRSAPGPARAELGFVKYRQGRKDEALKLLKAVVKDEPALLEGHYYLAAVLFQTGDVAGARAEYLAADALAGADTRPLVGLCEMETLSGTPERAEAEAKLRARFPKEAEALIRSCTAVTP